MSTLKQIMKQKIDAHRPRTTKLVKEFGDVSLGEVTIAQCIGGARGIKSLVTDISYLDPMEGIRFRGLTIPETFAALPKVPGSEYPYVEAFWFLLMTGDVPTMEQTLEIVEEWKSLSTLPQYVIDVVRALPRDSHPMVMFSSGILAMQRDSVFSNNYAAGKFNKMTCWEDMLDDCSFLMAKLAPLAAYIYRMKYKADVHIAPDPELDMGGNFAHMIGQSDSYLFTVWQTKKFFAGLKISCNNLVVRFQLLKVLKKLFGQHLTVVKLSPVMVTQYCVRLTHVILHSVSFASLQRA